MVGVLLVLPMLPKVPLDIAVKVLEKAPKRLQSLQPIVPIGDFALMNVPHGTRK